MKARYLSEYSCLHYTINIPNDEGGLAWNDPKIGIDWMEIVGEYNGTASAEGYSLSDGTPLNLSEKDQLWCGIEDTFKF